jgi:hypothetical protein
MIVDFFAVAFVAGGALREIKLTPTFIGRSRRVHIQSKVEMSSLAGITTGEAYGHHASGER